MRYELSDYEWTAIKPMLPRGAQRVNDRRVLNGIFFGSCARVPLGAIRRRYRPLNCGLRFSMKACLPSR
jgi:transposase